MAVVIVGEEIVPYAPLFPMPSSNFEVDQYNFSIRIMRDNAVLENKGNVLYFPGSGAGNFTATTAPMVTELTAKGYTFISFAYQGMGLSTDGPYRHGYGNVNAPHFTAMWIKTAWEVESAILHILKEAGSQNIPTVLLGHSRGAASILAWLAGYCGDHGISIDSFPGLKGAFTNGATVAGLGGFRWNDMNRNINTMCNIIALNRGLKTLMSWGGNDDFAPPDYVKRIQQAIQPGQESYVLNPNDTFGHSWISTQQGAPIMGQWVEQIFNNSPITLVDGVTPAVAGPTA